MEREDKISKGREMIEAAIEKGDHEYRIPSEVRDFHLVRVNGDCRANVPQIVYHSPSGFEWGYGGSGPADLALSILLTFLPTLQAFKLHQTFKWRFISSMPHEGGIIKGSDILNFIKENAPEVSEGTEVEKSCL